MDVRKIQGTIMPGGIIRMKTKSQQEIANQNILLWDIFNQPGIYKGIPNQMNMQVQPQMQLPSQQPTFVIPQQQQYFIPQNNMYQNAPYGYK